MKRVFARALVMVAAILWSMVSTGPAVASGFSTLVVDKTSYQHGDQIRICWLIPAAGTSKLTDTDPNGGSHVLRSGPDNGSGCVTGTIGAAGFGRECETLEFDSPRGSDSIQTCFQITEAASEQRAVADRPQLSLGDVSGPENTDIAIDGAGFQTFSYAAHGVTVFVKGPDGAEVDTDDIFPNADGTLHLTLHTANYAPGQYAVNARYTFVNAVSGRVSAANTQYLADGVSFSIE